MKIHYFQRYHSKENVSTANAMLLLSRLYQYSTDKFFQMLRSEQLLGDGFEPELSFDLQVKGEGRSVPDAVIFQNSFKIIVEAKLFDWFHEDQLIEHVKSFGNEKYKILLTLAPEYMKPEKKASVDTYLAEQNKSLPYPIRHVNTTFEALANAIRDVIDDRDYEMQEVLADFLDYCYADSLIPVSDGWKFLRVQLAGETFDFNIKENLYHDNKNRHFRAHDYIGLYTKKSVRAIGKVHTIISAEKDEQGRLQYQLKRGTAITEEHKEAILRAMENGKQRGYEMNEELYFFVEKFYATDFQKITPRPPMGSRVFDLTQILQTDTIPETEQLAKLLSEKTWG